MKTDLGEMDGTEWESYCQKLLRLRYEDYEEVPARFGGDWGIEGYSRGVGIVFQCYAPDTDTTSEELYELQRDKITKDISKLTRNAESIARVLRGQIREWHFLTPAYSNKNLLSHCRKKEEEVREKNLPSIHSGFEIYLKTEDHFIPQRQFFLALGSHKVQPSNQDLPRSEIDRLLEKRNSIAVNIDKKVSRMNLPIDEQAELKHSLLEGYVTGRAELQRLNEQFPAIFQSLHTLKATAEAQLPVRIRASRTNNWQILERALTEYEEQLTKEFERSLSLALIKRLGMEAISDWLGRCPLRIPRPTSSA